MTAEDLFTTKGKAIELLNRALPCPEQMKNIDLDKENAIYFDWRSQRYRLDLKFCAVARINGLIFVSDDASILMTQCLRAQLGAII